MSERSRKLGGRCEWMVERSVQYKEGMVKDLYKEGMTDCWWSGKRQVSDW